MIMKFKLQYIFGQQYLLRFFGNDQEVMTNRMLISLWDPYRVCRNYIFCENIQFMITGFDPSRADEVRHNSKDNAYCHLFMLINANTVQYMAA